MLQIGLSGTGGQGLIMAGIILAEAAIIDGKYAIQSQSYGPEARGGSSKAEVIIDDAAIDYPKVTEADIFLALSQDSCDKYFGLLKDGGTLIADEMFVKRIPETENPVLVIPITRTAIDQFGNAIFASVVALGALMQYTGVVSKDALLQAVLSRVPKGTEEKNRAAVEAGIALVG